MGAVVEHNGIRKTLGWIVVLFTACLVALFVAAGWLGLGGILVMLLVGPIGLALVVVAAGEAFRLRGEPSRAAVFALVALVVPLGIWVLGSQALYWGHVAPSWLLLRQHQAQFDRVVRARASTLPPGVLAVTREGPRIAFHTENGMLGAWTGIVFDPTARVAAAKGWGGRAPGAKQLRAFQSDVVWCQPLSGAYYHCSFD